MKRRQIGLQCLMYTIIALILVFLLFPVHWMVVTALKTNMEAYKYPLTPVSDEPTVFSFKDLLTAGDQFFVYYKNNFIVSDFAASISTCVALIFGYALSRSHFKWNRWTSAGLLLSQMFPVVSRMIPLYGLLEKVSLINIRVGLILAVVAAQIPFCTTLMSSFYDAISRELEEAATVGDSKRFQILFQVIMLLVKSRVLAVGTYSFLMTWDDYLHVVMLIQADALRMLLVGTAFCYLSELSYDWSLVSAISVVGAPSMILLFAFFQEYTAKGLVARIVKG